MQREIYKVNHNIKYPEVRVIDSDGQNKGILSTSDAIKMAIEQDLDLVVVTEGAKPPVAKILDYNKFLYEENKKNAQSRAKSKRSETKEFRVGAQIDDGGIQMRTRRAREFLEDGDKVKITVTMKGREKAYPQLALEKIEKFIKELEDIAKPESEIKKSPGNMVVSLVKK